MYKLVIQLPEGVEAVWKYSISAYDQETATFLIPSGRQAGEMTWLPFSSWPRCHAVTNIGASIFLSFANVRSSI